MQLYASANFKKDIHNLEVLFKKLVMPTIPKPVKPQPTFVSSISADGGVVEVPPDEADVDLYKEAIKQYSAREESLKASLRSLYNITWGQCSDLMK